MGTVLRMMSSAGRAGCVAALISAVAGCESVGFYSQAVGGQFEILMKRRSLHKVIADDDTPEEVRRKLELVAELVAYARDELGLPADGQYESYSDLKRDYVLWNVFAAPEFSLEPLQWCYPFAGCSSYRGYFKEEAARDFGAKLAEGGYDVSVGGVAAYSTLGWFDDPVLSTFIGRSEPALAALIFHELTHALLYLPGDTTFNESFATAVEEEGLRRWFEYRDKPDAFEAYVANQVRRGEFLELVRRWSEAFESMYATHLPDGEKRARKAEMFTVMREDYQRMESRWDLAKNGGLSFGGFFGAELNNARLVTVAEYRTWVDAFRALLEQEGGDLDAFYVRCRALAELGQVDRNERLEALMRAVTVH